ncbi:hypothetical protein [Ferruginibacter sp.]|nr:hypothetical protein [Ferruginibacter sp.]
MYKLLVILFFVPFFGACKQKKSTEDLKRIFYNKKGLFDKIVYNLRNIKLREGVTAADSSYMLVLKRSDEKLYNEITALGVFDLIAYYDIHCKGIEQYDFQMNWLSQKKDIYFDFNSCDTIETRKGYYRKDEKNNEFWGLGDGWKMWKLVEYLDYKQ